jgi:hypothetical protein
LVVDVPSTREGLEGGVTVEPPELRTAVIVVLCGGVAPSDTIGVVDVDGVDEEICGEPEVAVEVEVELVTTGVEVLGPPEGAGDEVATTAFVAGPVPAVVSEVVVTESVAGVVVSLPGSAAACTTPVPGVLVGSFVGARSVDDEISAGGLLASVPDEIWSGATGTASDMFVVDVAPFCCAAGSELPSAGAADVSEGAAYEEASAGVASAGVASAGVTSAGLVSAGVVSAGVASAGVASAAAPVSVGEAAGAAAAGVGGGAEGEGAAEVGDPNPGGSLPTVDCTTGAVFAPPGAGPLSGIGVPTVDWTVGGAAALVVVAPVAIPASGGPPV